MQMSYFLSFPECVLTTARPSSWYNPTFFPNLSSNEFRMKSLSLQISAQLPAVSVVFVEEDRFACMFDYIDVSVHDIYELACP